MPSYRHINYAKYGPKQQEKWAMIVYFNGDPVKLKETVLCSMKNGYHVYLFTSKSNEPIVD